MTDQIALPPRAEKPASRISGERLGLPMRVLELIFAALMLALYAFLRAHQTRNTGFFSEDFGWLEQLALYGPIFLGLLPPLVRAATGRRNPARPFEIITSLAQTAGGIWLLISFPFEFSHLGDVLPGGLQFLLDWANNPIGRFMLILQVIIGPIAAVLTLIKFLRVGWAEASS